MKHVAYPSISRCILIVLSFSSGVYAQVLSGRVYEGEYRSEPPAAQGLAGVTVRLYGSFNSGVRGVELGNTTTSTDGWYGFETESGFEFYTIVCAGKSGYSFQGAHSVGGSDSGEEIEYGLPLAGKTLTGNKFWYKDDTPPQADNPPVANDDSANTPQDSPVNIDVLANDSDPDGDPLHINNATDPPHGTTVNHGMQVTYTPDPGFIGTDTFNYTAGDGKGGTAIATVTVTVAEGPGPENNAPVANDDSANTPQDSPVNIDVLANDSDPDGDPLHVSNAADPPHGTTVNHGMHVTYTPDPGFIGTDTFNYTVSDGKGGAAVATVVVVVEEGPEPENNPPVANDDSASTPQDSPVNIDVLANDSDPDGDPLHVSNATDPPHGTTVNHGMHVTYTPDPGFIGTDTFNYTAEDGKGGSATSTVTVVLEEGSTQEPWTVVRGYKWHDVNGNGYHDVGEPKLPGWTIYLDINQNNQLDPSEPQDVTDVSGNFEIRVLWPQPRGIVTTGIGEVMQNGWQPINPHPMIVSFDSNQSQEITVNFGNSQEDESDPDPDQQIDVFDMCLKVKLTEPLGGTSTLSVSGPATRRVTFDGPIGAARDDDLDGLDEVDTELIDLNLTGQDPTFGQVTLKLHLNAASIGRIQEQLNNTPGTLDVSPYASGGLADSYFDAFFELQLSNTGLTFHTIQPVHLTAVLTHAPAVGPNPYAASLSSPMELYDAFGSPTGFRLDAVTACQSDGGGQYDFGDAPSAYPSTLARNGARHTPGGPWLGHLPPDTEVDAWVSGYADGDDAHVSDDEDGASFMTDIIPGQMAWLGLTLSGLGQNLTYAVWIDYNHNGHWEHPAELYSSGDAPSLPFSPFGLVIGQIIPAHARPGTTYVRCRVYQGLDVPVSPLGAAPGGEVEDFEIEINPEGQTEKPGHYLSGIKFNDIDGDGLWEPGDNELGLPNWTIWLDTNNDGKPDRTATTDSKGAFDFTGIKPGTYTIGENQKPGWAQTLPGGAGTYTVTVPNAPLPTIAFMMFGNTQGDQPTGEDDFGDAPDSYGTLRASGGPWHTLGEVYLGSLIDPEPDGKPSAQADADDKNITDDEDGVFSQPLKRGSTARFQMDIMTPTGVHAAYAAWIDFNGDGTFQDPQERATSGTVADATSLWTPIFQVPANAKPGKTYARVRLYRTEPGVDVLPSPHGPGGEGEVEDYQVTILSDTPGSDDGFDFGDAPDSPESPRYPTLLANNGARHIIKPGFHLGSAIDTESDGQATPLSDGDDQNSPTGTDDEDGVTMSPLIAPGQSVPITVVASHTGVINAWLDFNVDGDWADAGEQFITAQPVVAGTNSFTLNVPVGARLGVTHARFRFSSVRQLSYDGLAPDGEVEDYVIMMQEPEDGSIVIVKDAIPKDDTPFQFNWHFTGSNMYISGSWDLMDPSNNSLTILNPGSWNAIRVAEKVPNGWTLQSINIMGDWDNGSVITGGTVLVDFDPGENIVVTFKNKKTGYSSRFDFGDAPTSYGIAWHTPAEGLSIGATIDTEAASNTSSAADGDDIHGSDDEDGLSLGSGLAPGKTVEVCVKVYNQAAIPRDVMVAGWIDFDGNGQWNLLNEQIGPRPVHLPPHSTVNECVYVTVPPNAMPGITFGRFRLFNDTSGPGVSFAALPTGDGGAGEVEDYQLYTLSDAPGPDEEWDYGDAPASYPTLLANNGARHIISGPYFNDVPDAEADGQPNLDALGDDNDGNDDENGVDDIYHLFQGLPSDQWTFNTFNVAGGGGVVDAWIDYNGDGDWLDAGEHASSGYFTDGWYDFHVRPPFNAFFGETYARFRISSAGGLGPDGPAQDGEVEDIKVRVFQVDWGDAPSPYPTTQSQQGDWAAIVDTVFLGSRVDPDQDGQPHFNALGDDQDGHDDEDGIRFSAPLLPGQNATVQADYSHATATGYLRAWIDFNGDGDWDDANEKIFDAISLSPGLVHSLPFTIPASAVKGTTYARFRIDGQNPMQGMLGGYPWGEIEDYQITIGSGGPKGSVVVIKEATPADDTAFLFCAHYPLGSFFNTLCGNLTDPSNNSMTIPFPDQLQRVSETVPAGWTLKGIRMTGDLDQGSVFDVPNATVTVDYDEGENITIVFENEKVGTPTNQSIHGYKWHDLNSDGVWDTGSPAEPPLAGWTIWLDANQDGHPDQTTQTDASGHFVFAGLADGPYTLGEQQQAGWIQTWPASPGTHTTTLPIAQSSWPFSFGNQQVDSPDQPFDFGDAPDPTYPTLRANNGAYHTIDPDLFLGASMDGEADGQPSLDALGDDNAGTHDEDGVFFLTPLIPSQQAQVEVIVSANARLDGWIDFDTDGDWSQVRDHVIKNEPVLTGSNVISFHVPGTALADVTTYARFRVSWTGGLTSEGPATDGEVEDYHILLGEEGPGVPGEFHMPHVKWSQPPIEIDPNSEQIPVFCGSSESARSTEQPGRRRQWRMVVDDFRCLGPVPVTGIRWWGGYKAWESPEPPEQQPLAWHIGFWANTVDGLDTDQLYPERMVWDLEIPSERIQFEPVGLSEFPNRLVEACFRYELMLEPEEWFHQADHPSIDRIFWISVTAVYPPEVDQVNLWGWNTRSPIWGRGALMPAIMGDRPDPDERLFPGRISPVENAGLCGENRTYDLCFELLTEQPWILWDQPLVGLREWHECRDHASFAVENDDGHVTVERQVIDDWLCERPDPIVAITWHGSYLGQQYKACACDPVVEPRRPDYFLLSLHTTGDDPVHGVVPSDLIWEYRAHDYDEVFVGYDGSPQTNPNEPVFRYTVRLPEDEWFRGQVDWGYGLSVVAVYRAGPGDISEPWGWTNRPHRFGSTALGSFIPTQPRVEPLYDRNGEPIDMSFSLFTVPVLPAGQIRHSISTDGGASYEPGTAVSEAPVEVAQINPDMVVDSQGRIHVAWEDYSTDPSLGNIMYARSDAGGRHFGNTVMVDDAVTVSTHQATPKIALDEQGGIHMVWEDYRRNPDLGDIYYAKSVDGGASFGDDVLVDDPITITSRQVNPAMAVDSRGVIHVVWEDYRDNVELANIHYAKSTDGGRTFSPDKRINEVFDHAVHHARPTVVAQGRNTVYVLWEDYRNAPHLGDIYCTQSANGGQTFGENVMVDDPVTVTSRQIRPEAALDDNGILHVVWEDYRDDAERGNIYSARSIDSGKTFLRDVMVDSPFTVSTHQVRPAHPTIAVTGGGLVHVAWEAYRDVPDCASIYTSMSTDGGKTFDRDLEVAGSASVNGFRVNPAIAVDGQGAVHVLWQE